MRTNSIGLPAGQALCRGRSDAIFESALIAKLCTHNKDGTIHIAPLYFGTEGENVVVGTQEMTYKVANIRRDPRVTVLIDMVESRLKGVIVYGTALLEYEDVIPRRVAIFRKYKDEAGAQALAERLASTWTPVIIRIVPEQTITALWDLRGLTRNRRAGFPTRRSRAGKETCPTP